MIYPRIYSGRERAPELKERRTSELTGRGPQDVPRSCLQLAMEASEITGRGHEPRSLGIRIVTPLGPGLPKEIGEGQSLSLMQQQKGPKESLLR